MPALRACASGRVGRQIETFIDPAGDTACHDLDRPPEFGQPKGAARGAVAVRSGAIRHEQRIFRPLRKFGWYDLAVRQVDRPGHMPCFKKGGSTDIEQDKTPATLQRVMHIPAIGLEAKLRSKMLPGEFTRRGFYGNHIVGHGGSFPDFSGSPPFNWQLAQKTIYVKIMPNLNPASTTAANATPNGPLVVALVYDGLCTFEFGIAAEIFGLPRPEFDGDWYRFASCAVEPAPLRAAGGLSIQADGNTDLIDQADIIIVPGWKSADADVPHSLIERLVQAHQRGAQLVSICSGAFVLAATGLLDGRTATTHWRYADQLRARFPEVTVDEGSLYRLEDRIHTSAGSAAGIDLMLEIIRRDYGVNKANSVARRLVVPAQRSGGQAQFLERPVSARPGGTIAPFLEEVRNRLSDDWPIGSMAASCNMSSRTFQRRFVEAVGLTPGEWVNLERVEAAKDMLATGRDDMETVASRVGFASAHALRHHFRKRLGLSPTDYRALYQPAVA